MNNTTQHPEELLPWYINGSLTDTERQSVDAHIQSCEKCQNEIAFLKIMREQVKATAASPGELAKLRFMRDIKNVGQHSEDTGRGESATSNVIATGRSWVQQAFAIAAVLVITVQAAFLVKMSDPAKDYKLASGATSESVLKIRFKPESTYSKINAVLQEANVTIKRGPDNEGFYMIGLKKATLKKLDKKSSDKLIRDILSKLEQKQKQKNSIIEYVDTP